jgi:hypothetical protein
LNAVAPVEDHPCVRGDYAGSSIRQLVEISGLGRKAVTEIVSPHNSPAD